VNNYVTPKKLSTMANVHLDKKKSKPGAINPDYHSSGNALKSSTIGK
jgi:hypothetical protein